MNDEITRMWSLKRFAGRDARQRVLTVKSDLYKYPVSEKPIRCPLEKQKTLVLQYRGVLLLLHKAGQGSAVLAAGAGRVGYICFYIFHLSSISNVLSFGRRLNMTEML